MKITKQSLRQLIKEEVSALREERQFKLDPELQEARGMLDVAIEAVEGLAEFVQWVPGEAEGLSFPRAGSVDGPGAEYEVLEKEVLIAREALQRAALMIEDLAGPQ